MKIFLAITVLGLIIFVPAYFFYNTFIADHPSHYPAVSTLWSKPAEKSVLDSLPKISPPRNEIGSDFLDLKSEEASFSAKDTKDGDKITTEVKAVGLKTDKLLWSYITEGDLSFFGRGLYYRNGYLYLNTVVCRYPNDLCDDNRPDERYMIKIDGVTGKEVWKATGAVLAVSPDGTKLYITKNPYRRKDLQVINSQDQTKIADLPVEVILDTPLLQGDRLYISSGPLSALDITTNQIVWKSDSYSLNLDEILYSDQNVFVVRQRKTIGWNTWSDDIHVIDKKTGKTRWSWAKASLASVDSTAGIVYIVSGDTLFAIKE